MKILENKKYNAFLYTARCGTKLKMFEQNPVCRAKRAKEVGMAKMWYKITDGSDDRQAEFGLKQVPWLDQKLKTVFGFYGLNDFESAYLGSFMTWKKVADGIEEKMVKAFEKLPYESDAEFIKLYAAFNNALSQVPVSHFFCVTMF